VTAPRPAMLEIVILGYLRKNCGGHAAARTEARIARDLQDLGLAAEPRDVREAVASLSLAGWPVATDGHGCFICVEPRDWRRGYRNLYTRLRTQAKRCRKFKANYREAVNGQRRFDFAEAAQRYADLEQAPLLAAETLTGAEAPQRREN